MNLKDLYINFFVSKGHKQIPSAPVVPENDNTVLFNEQIRPRRFEFSRSHDE